MDGGHGESGRMVDNRKSPNTIPTIAPTTTSFEHHDSPVTSLNSSNRLESLSDYDNPSLSDLQHQRQPSAPTFSPSSAGTLPQTPKRSHVRQQSQGMPLTGDGRKTRRRENSPGEYGSWLNQAAASPPLDGRLSLDATPSTKRGVSTAESTPKSATPSRFGFLSWSSRRTSNQPTQITPEQQEALDDELCTMDIEAALYPSSSSSSPPDRDTFSPAAYKNLQMNAAGVLHRMQEAFERRTATLREIQAEREAQREEAEETELRIRHFKTQLESMAEKAAKQETDMRRLVADLQAEKQARLEEKICHEKMLAAATATGTATTSEGSVVTEDLCVGEDEERERDGRRRSGEGERRLTQWRKSSGTVRSDVSAATTDSTRASVESESIFSRSRSPTTMTACTADYGPPENPEVLLLSPPPPPPARASTSATLPSQQIKPQQRRPAPQLTTFQKLVKGISGGDNAAARAKNSVDGCTNCRGQAASVAWDTVSLLRDENKGLKQRVVELEVVVEGALDVVNGIGIR